MGRPRNKGGNFKAFLERDQVENREGTRPMVPSMIDKLIKIGNP